MAANDFNRVTLDQLVSGSQVIVVATPENPPWRKQDISMEAPGRKKVPPYQQALYRFRVSESLLGEVDVGSIIEVVEADTGMAQSVYYNYEAEGINMSVDWRRYTQRNKPAEGSSCILFLRKTETQLEFIVHNGCEDISTRAEVQRLIAQRPPRVESW